MPRHGTEELIENTEELYEELFEERDVNFIVHYKSPRWTPLDAKARSQFASVKHVWKMGDKWWNLPVSIMVTPRCGGLLLGIISLQLRQM